MPDENKFNPFEDFISSEAFDVSKLEEGVSVRSHDAVEREIHEFLDSLPQPLDYELWDTELTDRQKKICAYLVTELIDEVLRPNHAEELQDLTDEELMHIMTVPLTIAMIAERRLHKPPPSTTRREIAPIVEATPSHPLNYGDVTHNPDLPANWGEIFQNTVTSIKRLFARLFRRY